VQILLRNTKVNTFTHLLETKLTHLLESVFKFRVQSSHCSTGAAGA